MPYNVFAYELWRVLARTSPSTKLPGKSARIFRRSFNQAIAYMRCWQLAFYLFFYLSIETKTFSIPSFCHSPFLNSGRDLKFPKTPELSLNL